MLLSSVYNFLLTLYWFDLFASVIISPFASYYVVGDWKSAHYKQTDKVDTASDMVEEASIESNIHPLRMDGKELLAFLVSAGEMITNGDIMGVGTMRREDRLHIICCFLLV